jgi:hypothetical protein
VPIAHTLATGLAVFSAKVLKCFALACGMVVYPGRIHIVAMVCDKDGGRDAQILAFFLCVTVVATANVDQATVLVIDAVQRRHLLEPTSTPMCPLMRLVVNVLRSLRSTQVVKLYGPRRLPALCWQLPALHKVGGLLVLVYARFGVVIVTCARCVNSTLPNLGFVKVMLFYVTMNVVRLARRQIPLVTTDAVIAYTSFGKMWARCAAVCCRNLNCASPDRYAA